MLESPFVYPFNEIRTKQTDKSKITESLSVIINILSRQLVYCPG